MNNLFAALGVFAWTGLGAAAVLSAWLGVELLREKRAPSYAPFAELLGKPCWINEGGEYTKFRIVAVSHKGSMAVRRWDDDSGRHAKWIPRKSIGKSVSVYFEERGL